ncbi:Zn-dependent hydrolase [Paraliomyxa miuraensis]|uniref:Zn-dependent hydrolase n=1 Tax=Paraliomyxa miuraensis TaxID=376150 RepID=UPI002253FF57|nr:Zn-dependent hydrolase [Paraliomyxa miuraensis]MCX4242320.1 Zn-dependent hydrolase [Paraliomyxa miuraensis]
MSADLRIDPSRLLDRIRSLGQVGALPGGGVCRLALTEEDRRGRDRVRGWMEELGLEVGVDPLGNVVGVWPGTEPGPPVMTGSHIDTVRTGGLYDGNLGVLAGLEVIETLQRAGVRPRRSLAVGFFTNEEGARFAPDMMGSLYFVGALPLRQARAVVGIDGKSVGEALDAIGYAGASPPMAVHAFVELHVEQGPVLEEEGVTIGVVEGVQGISWTEFTVTGISNHAGTTPLRLRHDAGWVAGSLIQYVRTMALELGGDQIATVGSLRLHPDLVNVIPNRAVFTVDLRNTDEAVLQQAEARLHAHVRALAEQEGVTVAHRSLARFEPVSFEPELVDRIEATALRLGHTTRRMPSGAGHDAQMLARICPAAMIFVPSVRGISHNVAEHTDPADLEAGANVLLQVMCELAT